MPKTRATEVAEIYARADVMEAVEEFVQRWRPS